MKAILLLALILFLSGPGHTQKTFQDFTPSRDTVHYGPAANEVFPPASKGYALFLPDNGKEPKGTVLILEDDKPNFADTATLVQPANAGGLAVLYISTGIPIDLYFSENSLTYVDTQLKKVFSKYHLPNKNIDIRYWFSAPGKGIYDSNYPDMSGFINEQRLAGNKKASLVVFSSSLTGPIKNDMRKQSTTWNLIDKKELVEWMLKSM